MNWTVVVYGGPMLLVTLWWLVSARKWFKGPVRMGSEEELERYEAELEKKTGVAPG